MCEIVWDTYKLVRENRTEEEWNLIELAVVCTMSDLLRELCEVQEERAKQEKPNVLVS
jgi:hypothetical protein